MSIEVEIKLRVTDLREVLGRLVQLGFVAHRERSLERNQVFDTAEGALRRTGSLLRLRDFSGKNTLTYKGPGRPGLHKSREEIEVDVSAAGPLRDILDRLGYRLAFLYEKYRAEYQRPGEPGLVMVDETPIGDFLEIEGAPEWIDSTAAALGFAVADYITLSYGALFALHRQQTPNSPPNMLFQNPP